MKASDLMIGDYVTVTPSGMVIKIAAIHNKKVAYHACISKLSWVIESLLRPIPLTQDILEKNGWEHWCNINGDIEGYFEGDNHNYFEIAIDNNGIWWSLSFNDNEYYILELKYVHELQNALRLNGIKKAIVL